MEALASVGARVLGSWKTLSDCVQSLPPDSAFHAQVSPESVEDGLTRYRLWAGNLALLHHGHASLDYRLRQAPTVEKTVRNLLKDLFDTLFSSRLTLDSEWTTPTHFSIQ